MPGGRRKKKRRNYNRAPSERQLAATAGDSAPSESVSSSGKDDEKKTSKQEEIEVEALLQSIEDSSANKKPVSSKKKKKRGGGTVNRSDASQENGISSAHAETQLFEIVALDSMYPRSLGIVGIGLLDPKAELLQTIKRAPWVPVPFQTLTALSFLTEEHDVAEIAQRVRFIVDLTSACLSDNPLAEDSTVKTRPAVPRARLEVEYPTAYPEVSPALLVQFSYEVPLHTQHSLTKSIQDILTGSVKDSLQVERIVPVCELIFAVLLEWDSFSRERDSALWEQMQNRETRVKLAALAAPPAEEESVPTPEDLDVWEPCNEAESTSSALSCELTRAEDENLHVDRLPSFSQRELAQSAGYSEEDSHSSATFTTQRSENGPVPTASWAPQTRRHRRKNNWSKNGADNEEEVRRRALAFWNIFDVQVPVNYAPDTTYKPGHKITRQMRRSRHRFPRHQRSLKEGSTNATGGFKPSKPFDDSTTGVSKKQRKPGGDIAKRLALLSRVSSPQTLFSRRRKIQHSDERLDSSGRYDHHRVMIPLQTSHSGGDSTTKATGAVVDTTKPRTSRYTKDFEEVAVFSPGAHLDQVVTKVRHRIDFNLYAIKRVAWPTLRTNSTAPKGGLREASNTLHHNTPSSNVSQASGEFTEDLGRVPASTAIDADPTPKCSIYRNPSLLTFIPLSVVSHHTDIEPTLAVFSTSLYRQVMLEISKLSQVQHRNVARVFQGWVQKATAFDFPVWLKGSSGGPAYQPSDSVSDHTSDISVPGPFGAILGMLSPDLPAIASYQERVLCVQMEHCPQMTLREWIDRASLGSREHRKVWNIFRQLLEVLVVLHRDRLFHRALHPGNIFIENYSHPIVKVGDFGLANLLRREVALLLCSIRVGGQITNSNSIHSFRGVPSPTPSLFQYRQQAEQTILGGDVARPSRLEVREPLPKRVLQWLVTESEGYSPEEFFTHSVLVYPNSINANSCTRLVQDDSNENPSDQPRPVDVLEEKSDIFALGLILFEMLCDPFEDQQARLDAISKITARDCSLSELLGQVGIHAASHLIWQLTDPDPLKRPTAAHLLYKEPRVPSAISKILFDQFLNRLRNSSTAESVAMSSVLYARILDSYGAARFFSVQRVPPHLRRKLSTAGQARLVTLGPLALLGVDATATGGTTRQKEGCLWSPEEPETMHISNACWTELSFPMPEGFYFGQLKECLGAYFPLLHITEISPDEHRQLLHSLRLFGAQLADLSVVRHQIVLCDCGASVKHPLRLLGTTSNNTTPVMEKGGFCWRAAMEAIELKRLAVWTARRAFVNNEPCLNNGCQNTERENDVIVAACGMPFYLLEMTGGLACLTTNLLEPFCAFCASLYLSARRSRGSKQGIDLPTCIRLYSVQSVYRDGLFYKLLTDPTEDIFKTCMEEENNDGLPTTKEPSGSLRAVYSVIVGPDVSSRDLFWDRSNLNSNLLIVEAEHILSVVDGIQSLQVFIGQVHVVWGHTDILRLILMDLCQIHDKIKLNLLDKFIRLFGLPHRFEACVYLLYMASVSELEERMINSDTSFALFPTPDDWASISFQLSAWMPLWITQTRELIDIVRLTKSAAVALQHPCRKSNELRGYRREEEHVSHERGLSSDKCQKFIGGQMSEDKRPVDSINNNRLNISIKDFQARMNEAFSRVIATRKDTSLESSSSKDFLEAIRSNEHSTEASLAFKVFVESPGGSVCVAGGGRHDDLVRRHLSASLPSMSHTGGTRSSAVRPASAVGPVDKTEPVPEVWTDSSTGPGRVAAVVAQCLEQQAILSQSSGQKKLLRPSTSAHSQESRDGGDLVVFGAEINLERLAEIALAVSPTYCGRDMRPISSPSVPGSRIFVRRPGTSGGNVSSALDSSAFDESLADISNPYRHHPIASPSLFHGINPAVVIVAPLSNVPCPKTITDSGQVPLESSLLPPYPFVALSPKPAGGGRSSRDDVTYNDAGSGGGDIPQSQVSYKVEFMRCGEPPALIGETRGLCRRVLAHSPQQKQQNVRLNTEAEVLHLLAKTLQRWLR